MNFEGLDMERTSTLYDDGFGNIYCTFESIEMAWYFINGAFLGSGSTTQEI